MSRLLLSVCLVALAAPAYAQSEAELKNFFEGKNVRIKMDMPATQQGIDVYPDARRAVNFEEYSARLKSTGVAIRNGDSVLVTKVRIKDKLIEFQLAGGGYGTFGDDTSGSVYTSSTPKSNREKDLERLVKSETDAARKRGLQRELDDLRAERAREDLRNQAASATASEAKKTRIAENRVHSGSRFNIRYQNGVPPGLGPDGIMRALADYVEFPFATDRPQPAAMRDTRVASPEVRRQMAGTGAIRKGMTIAEVEDSLGKAEKTTERSEGALKVVTAIFSRDDQRITAEFVEGVLIRYSIASK
ncbi:MAG TPA: hypothetical protein VEL51_08420 [Vicinamibacterales bacterium]|nr:hypothetical protein [Vicinamibacterales bacterium]